MAQQHDVNFVIRAQNLAKTAFEDIKRSFSDVEKSSVSLRSALATLGVGLSAAGFVSFVKTSVDAAASLDDLSEKTGASVEELSKLQQVARISGTDFGVVETFLVKLNKALHETDEEGKGANRALEAIGLNAAKLRQLDPAQAMLEVAKALDQFADSGAKGAAIQALTGKSASEALPFLKDLARETGIVARVTAEQAAQAEELQKSIRRLGNAFTEAAQALARDLIPGLARTLEQFTEGRRIAGGFFEAIMLFGTINPFRTAGGNVKALTDELGRLHAQRERFIQQGRTGFLPQQDAEIEKVKKQIEFSKLLQRQEALALTERSRGRLDARDLGPSGGGRRLDFTPDNAAKDSRFESAIKQLEQEALRVQDLTKLEEVRAALQAGHFGKLSEAQAKRLQQLASEVDIERGNAEERKRALELQKEVQRLADESLERQNQAIAREGEQLTALREKYIDLIDPIQKFRIQLDEIDKLQDRGLLRGDQATAARLAINEQIEAVQGLNQELKKTDDTARDLGLVFKSMFEDAVVEGKKLREVVQGLVQDLARLVLRRGVTEPLSNFGSDLIKELFPRGFSLDAITPSASGGHRGAGQLLLVGEEGPELFRPDSAGVVIPNHAMGGSVVININNPSNADQVLQAVPLLRALVRGELGNQLRPGGALR